MGIMYSQISNNPPPYDMTDYVNNKFVGNLADQKLVMRYYFFFNRVVVSWSSKKQRTVSISTTKAKYITLGHIVRDIIWIQRLVNEMDLDMIENLMLYDNNEMNINLTRNIESQHYIKHINV